MISPIAVLVFFLVALALGLSSTVRVMADDLGSPRAVLWRYGLIAFGVVFTSMIIVLAAP